MTTETVYLVRGKGGEYARGTKICSSGRGAKNSLNAHVDALIDYEVRKNYPTVNNPISALCYLWQWGGYRKHFKNWSTLEKAIHQMRIGVNVSHITEQSYDEYMKIVERMYDYWFVEKVEQKC